MTNTAQPHIAVAFEDLREGQSREITVTITRTHIVKYAGASGDFAPIHHDDELARGLGNPSVFAHGMLSSGIMGTLLADWLGVFSLRKLNTRIDTRVFPGDEIRYEATISSKYQQDGQNCVDCDLKATNQESQSVLNGKASAVVASRETLGETSTLPGK